MEGDAAPHAREFRASGMMRFEAASVSVLNPGETGRAAHLGSLVQIAVALEGASAVYETEPIRTRLYTTPGMPLYVFAKRSQSCWNGFVCAKHLACIQLSEILGAEPLARMSPLLRCGADGAGDFEKRSQSTGGPLYAALTSGVSVAGG